MVIETFTQLSFHVICVPPDLWLAPQIPSTHELRPDLQCGQSVPTHRRTQDVRHLNSRLVSSLHAHGCERASTTLSAPPHACFKPSCAHRQETPSPASPSSIAHKLACCPKTNKRSINGSPCSPLRPVRSGAQCCRHSPTNTWKVAQWHDVWTTQCFQHRLVERPMPSMDNTVVRGLSSVHVWSVRDALRSRTCRQSILVKSSTCFHHITHSMSDCSGHQSPEDVAHHDLPHSSAGVSGE